MSDISETSVWLNFFIDAGVPPSDATSYAIAFTDNRIKKEMLADLNKEYLRDMGITATGDIIGILKHGMTVYNQLSKQKAFPVRQEKKVSSEPKLKSKVSTGPTPKRNTPATRMLEHYVRKEPPPSPPHIPQQYLPSRLNNNGSSTTKRSSVFSRLSENDVSSSTDAPKITVTLRGNQKISSSRVSSSKRMHGFISSDDSGDSDVAIRNRVASLQYHGVLKYPARDMPEKVIPIRMKSINSKINTTDSGKLRARIGAAPRRPSESEGILAKEYREESRIRGPTAMRSERLSPLVKKVKRMSFKEYSPPHSVQRPSGIGKKVIKKIVRINKKTGEIISTEKREVKSGVFNRLGD